MVRDTLFILLTLILCSWNWQASLAGGREDYVWSERDYLQGKWTKLAHSQQEGLRALMDLLRRSKTGRNLLDRVQVKLSREGLKFEDLLSPGPGSLTDTALIRRFGPDRPHEMEISFRTKVYINDELSILEAVLDLAHELTHYVDRRPFNPYEDGFSLEKFIRNTVEGEGGEVAAYMTECQVLYELFPAHIRKNFHCNQIINPRNGQFSRSMSIRQFYKIGHLYRDFKSQLQAEGLRDGLPLLSEDEAVFISSAYGLPYPVAAFKEFKVVMEKACENDRRRLQIMKENLLQLHHSQETAFLEQRPLMEGLEKSYFHRCERQVPISTL